jgi:hypothetical protein
MPTLIATPFETAAVVAALAQAEIATCYSSARRIKAPHVGPPLAVHEDRVKNRAARARNRIRALANSHEAFAGFSDPRSSAQMLDDAMPLLLFPLRLETRFGTIMQDGVLKTQLWVRVYPDDCLIDSFEPLPSETEIASSQRYWINMWKARGIESQERGAWRSFVASHGSGRAAWLEANYRPRNFAAKPNNPAADALVLVIPTETPIVDPEATAMRTFWRSVWLAGDNRRFQSSDEDLARRTE